MIKKKCLVKIGKEERPATLRVFDHEIIFETYGHSVRVEGTFPFVILREIRKELEKLNMYLLINASRVDVYPSGLSAIGFNAYVLHMGKPAMLEQLVDIFDPVTEAETIGTVAEQEEFHIRWINSLGP